jgi:hypothetical protein
LEKSFDIEGKKRYKVKIDRFSSLAYVVLDLLLKGLETVGVDVVSASLGDEVGVGS